MSIINLEDFRNSIDVDICGQTYSLTLFTMQDYVNKAVDSRLDRALSTNEFFSNAIAILLERTSIPECVLLGLTHRQIEVLLLLIQGIDPAKFEHAGGDSGKK